MEIPFSGSRPPRPTTRSLNKGESALLEDLRQADVFKPGEVEELGLIPQGSPRPGAKVRNLQRQGGFASFGTLMTIGGLGLAIFGQETALRVAGGLLVMAGLHEQRWERGEDVHANSSWDIHSGVGDIHSGSNGDIHGALSGDIHRGSNGDIHGALSGDIHSGSNGDIHGALSSDIDQGVRSDIH